MSTSWAPRDTRRVCRTPVRLSVQRVQDARQPAFEGARGAESNGEPKVVEPARFKKLLNLMLDDEIAVEEGKVEMKGLDGRRKELEAQLQTADEPPPLPAP
jgi:hypothetical protein